jgi:hypothetical protein
MAWCPHQEWRRIRLSVDRSLTVQARVLLTPRATRRYHSHKMQLLVAWSIGCPISKGRPCDPDCLDLARK